MLLIGIIAGFLSGLVGIGGGVIIVPSLILLYGFSQYSAQGTTLALLIPPIGFFAVREYYMKGYVDLKTATLICIGFIIGGYIGGKSAVHLPQEILRKIFAVVIILLGIKMLLIRE